MNGVPDNLKRGIQIVATNVIDEVLEHALVSKPTPIEWIEPKEVERLAEPSGMFTH